MQKQIQYGQKYKRFSNADNFSFHQSSGGCFEKPCSGNVSQELHKRPG